LDQGQYYPIYVQHFIDDEDYYCALEFYLEIVKLSPLHTVFQCAAQTIATLGTGATMWQTLIISRLSKNKILDRS